MVPFGTQPFETFVPPPSSILRLSGIDKGIKSRLDTSALDELVQTADGYHSNLGSTRFDKRRPSVLAPGPSYSQSRTSFPSVLAPGPTTTTGLPFSGVGTPGKGTVVPAKTLVIKLPARKGAEGKSGSSRTSGGGGGGKGKTRELDSGIHVVPHSPTTVIVPPPTTTGFGARRVLPLPFSASPAPTPTPTHQFHSPLPLSNPFIPPAPSPLPPPKKSRNSLNSHIASSNFNIPPFKGVSSGNPLTEEQIRRAGYAAVRANALGGGWITREGISEGGAEVSLFHFT